MQDRQVHHMQPVWCLICLVAVTLVLISTVCCGAGKPVDDPRFRFNPPDGAAFTVKGKVTLAVDDKFTPKEVESWQYEERVEFKRNQKGYILSRIPVSVSCRVNERTLTEEDMPHYLQVYLSRNTKPVCELASNGEMLSFRGHVEALEKAKVDLKLKPEDVEILSAQIKSLEAIRKAHWNVSVRSLEGRSAKPGASWTTEGMVDGPTALPIKATYK